MLTKNHQSAAQEVGNVFSKQRECASTGVGNVRDLVAGKCCTRNLKCAVPEVGNVPEIGNVLCLHPGCAALEMREVLLWEPYVCPI